MKQTIFVTGGYGFIGSHFIKKALYEKFTIINIDKISYAANINIVNEFKDIPYLKNYHIDISCLDPLKDVFNEYRPVAVLNFAAETHVDNSIHDGDPFMQTNIIGTYNLLRLSLEYWNKFNPQNFKFLQVSTDEVFGALGQSGFFNEDSPIMPRNPYSASKASADHFVNSFHNTFGLPTIITNCSNNFGTHQNVEKFIPKTIASISNNNPVQVYGNGQNVRDWLYVETHVESIWKILIKGNVGERYCIGGGVELTNLQLVNKIYDLVEANLGQYKERKINFIPDRPGHDFRYAIDNSKFEREFGISRIDDFEQRMNETVQWYIDLNKFN